MELKDIGLDKLENKSRLLFLILGFILFGSYFFYSNYLFRTQGVYSICRVEYYEPGGSGSDLHIIIYYHGQEFKTVANAMCNNCDNKLYFVQIVKNKPMGTVRFLAEYPVPNCISISKLPPEGWEQIPTCK